MVNFIASSSVGFYGKLPIVGDFVSRRLPEEFITPWDDWLQSAMAASREMLGEDWLNSFLTSPIWRFLLSPGVCGNKAVAGIVLPSVDRVGRYFPLTLAVVFEQMPDLPFLMTTGNVWFELLEDTALTGLEGNLDLQAFDQLIQAIPVFSMSAGSSTAQQAFAEKNPAYLSMEPFGQTAAASMGLNAQLLAGDMSGYSLWHNPSSGYVGAYEGLPPIASFAEFLIGKHDPKEGLVKSVNNPNASVTPTPVQMTDLDNSGLMAIMNSTGRSLTEPRWRSWAITHTGKCRKHNEDALLDRPEARLWVVADGMGGHKAGDVASQLIVDSLKKLPPAEPLEAYARQIEQCLQNVNAQLKQLAAQKYGNQLVGSTVVGLVCETGRCAFLWAGDSRLYRLRDGILQQLTQDHCAGDGQHSSSWSVKNVNVITRAVGADEGLMLDIAMAEVLAGDIFLLCSDGLDKEMSFKEIERIMCISEPQDIARTLMDTALARDAKDNISVIVVTQANNNAIN